MNSRNNNKREKPKDAVERFNTDDGLKPSTKKVGAGYDDTGKGNDAHASRLDEKKYRRRENNSANKK